MTQLHRDIGEAHRLLGQNRPVEAARLAASITLSHPTQIDGWLLLARAHQRMTRFSDMAIATAKALDINSQSMPARLMHIEALDACGRTAEALAQLKLAVSQDKDAAGWRHLAEVQSQFGYHSEAIESLQRAVAQDPSEARSVGTAFAFAANEVALGRLDAAEKRLNKVIARAPQEFEAYYTRSTLRRQTDKKNHINELERVLSREGQHPRAQVLIRFALSKELEDVGRRDEAFEQVRLGAAARRRGLAYDVTGDEGTMQKIRETFDSDFFANIDRSACDGAPFFIVGLPRSGTTLVDRILSSSDRVRSLGEINYLAQTILGLAGPAKNKNDLIAKTATEIDYTALGAAYMKAVGGFRYSEAHLIDKTPFNTLYVGLIAAALPNARIIYVRRHPLANGHATFKTLFRMGYPWSYDLTDIGRYAAAHQALMEHWEKVLPGRMITVDYEKLVADQEGVTRRLFDECGLDWTDESLQFHKNKSPVSTASAAQVRRPIYKDATELWRHYETQLEPLKRAFEANGGSLSQWSGP